MKATFEYTAPIQKTIKIPKRFEFLYDGTPEEKRTAKQWDLADEWFDKVLPKLLGIEVNKWRSVWEYDIECWDIER